MKSMPLSRLALRIQPLGGKDPAKSNSQKKRPANAGLIKTEFLKLKGVRPQQDP
jgi:hypothetical protein